MPLSLTTNGIALKPRSILFDIFGSYVRYRSGVIGLSNLTQLLGWFGISEDSVRVTLSRMKREKWFSSERAGRASFYSLTPKGWELLDEGLERIFERYSNPWDGNWHMLIYSIPEEHRSAREKFRKELTWRGFSSLAASTWVSPHDRSEGLRSFLPPGSQMQIFSSRTPSSTADVEIAASCWDLVSLNEDYKDFIRAFEPWADPSATKDFSPEQAFVTRTQITHDYRLFPFRDPDLPIRLLPHDWSGHKAHSVFRATLRNLEAPAWIAFDSVYEQPPTVITGAPD